MTQARLEEILSQDNVSNEEMSEILGDMFLSFSKHFKEIKRFQKKILKYYISHLLFIGKEPLL